MLWKLQQRYLSSTFARSLTSTSVSTGLLKIVSCCSTLQFPFGAMWVQGFCAFYSTTAYLAFIVLVIVLNTTLFNFCFYLKITASR